MIEVPKLPRSHDEEPGYTQYLCHCTCGHTWTVRDEKPVCCPECGNTDTFVCIAENRPFKQY